MASGDTLLIFSSLANEAPSSNYSTFDTRNQHVVLDFDDGTDEAAFFSSVMPQHYTNATGISVYIHYSMTSATSGAVIWDVAIERLGDGQQDIDSDGFTSVNSVTDTVPGTSGHTTIASIDFDGGSDMDSVLAGESFRIKLSRDANNGSDDASGDAELHKIEIRER